MAQNKPLPTLPINPPDVAVLSVDAHNHRAALIVDFLNDLHDASVENQRDSWLHVVEEVLDNLGHIINSEAWLTRIWKGKELKKSLIKQTTNDSDAWKDKVTTKGAQPGAPIDRKELPEIPRSSSLLQPVQQLSILSSRPVLPVGEIRPGRLVLCLAPYQADDGFDISPGNIGCAFSSGNFLLQDSSRADDIILFGLDGLENNVVDTPLELVGGTFTLKGVSSPQQHYLLAKVLKLAIYVHLSMILEQHLLSDSGIHPRFPQPKVLTPPSKNTNTSYIPNYKEVHLKARNSLLPSNLTSFLAKHNIRYRAESASQAQNAASLEPTVSPTEGGHPRRSAEGLHEGHLGGRLRKLSFIGEKRHSFLRVHHRELPRERKDSSPRPFTNALSRLEKSRGLLSTSAGVAFSSPKIMVDLSEKERMRLSQAEIQVRGQRLNVDERMALGTLLGWEGKDAEGRGMSGILGFLRQQEISVLFSARISLPSSKSPSQTPSYLSAVSTVDEHSTSAQSSTFTTASTTTESSSTPRTPGFVACGKPCWVTYRYYSLNPEEDWPLGDWILDMANNKDKPCIWKPGCRVSQANHHRILIHDGVKITVKLANVSQDWKRDGEDQQTKKDGEDDGIEIWESCAVCGVNTPKRLMRNGTRLFSFAKYLELLLYSPLFCHISPSICEHTTAPSPPWTTLPAARFDIIRHFSAGDAEISFTLSNIHDIFELRLPRLQVTRGLDTVPSPFGQPDNSEDPDKRKALRREIRKWWEAVSDHIDKIEKLLEVEAKNYQKTLPRLPSVDEAYDVFNEDSESNLPTPTPSTARLPPTPPTPVDGTPNETDAPGAPASASQLTTPSVPPKDKSDELLSSLRQHLQQVERSLYVQLAKTPEKSLNDVRRAFLSAAKGTKRRLKAWQDKHLGSRKSKIFGDLKATEPEWWGRGCHVVPGGNIIVQENDWGSIIAHTLSTADYQLEMTNLSASGSNSQTNSDINATPTSAFFSVVAGYHLFAASSKNQPDPDKEDVVWNEAEQYSAVISRKGDEPSSLPSIRHVLNRGSSADSRPSSAYASRISKNIKNSSALSVSRDSAAYLVAPVIGEVADEPEAAGTKEKDLQEDGQRTPTHYQSGSSKSEVLPSTDYQNIDALGEQQVSTTPKEVDDRLAVQRGETSHPTEKSSPDRPPTPLPPLPPKDFPLKDEITLPASFSKKSSPLPLPPLPPTSSGFATSLATGLNNAMKYVLSGSEASSRFLSQQLPSTRRGRNLNLSDIHHIDERPHIKYDWTMGNQVKFSCTVYYAKQFDLLRRRCGVHDTFVTSLSRSANWAAEGGKSKSNFWKTSDDRYIIKTLVNAWNVADLHVLLEHAPMYFRYMDATASKPTALAKLMGFYTIEIRDLETGAVQTKSDLLVMENLFYGMNIVKKFDLKGIQGRKAKNPGNTTKTLFDGDWIEGQQKVLTLVRPHSKALLQDAIRSDAEFLSKSNIMDYSLLLGMDEEKKEIVCGLVDTVGSYTFAKTLEYKAKQGLQGKEVTVVPPAEYQKRFVNTLEGYFVACPDKWSKSFADHKVVNDLKNFPSVL